MKFAFVIIFEYSVSLLQQLVVNLADMTPLHVSVALLARNREKMMMAQYQSPRSPVAAAAAVSRFHSLVRPRDDDDALPVSGIL